MFNKPISKTEVEISKQDITTSKELPGASLVVKDKNGKTIGSIQPDILSDISLDARTITIFSKKSGVTEVGGYVSPAEIKMTIKAPTWSDGNTTFIDAQYRGYIVANLTYN